LFGEDFLSLTKNFSGQPATIRPLTVAGFRNIIKRCLDFSLSIVI
jgi:hypothetical protein